MPRAIQLIRVSTEAQAGSDRASLASQRAINARTAQTYGLTIVKTIEIVDVSGAAVMLSPEMQELLRLIADKEIGGVVTREFSRLMRPENFSDYALLQAFAETGTQLYLPDGPIDFGSKMGRLVGPLRAAMAGIERTEMLEKVWAAKESKRRAGGFAQSRVCLPHGVTFDGKWSYTPEAEQVREAFKLLLTGELNYYELGRRVGIKPFNLRVILRNPIYTGWRVIDKRRDTSVASHKTKANGKQADRPKIQRAPEDVIRQKVIEQGLITEVEFARAQEMMAHKRKRHYRNQTGYKSRFLFSGFLTCSLCGDLVYTNYRRRDYYVCKRRCLNTGCSSKYMRREILDPALDSLFANQFSDPKFLERIARAWAKKPTGDDPARFGRLMSQQESLQGKRQRILDSYFDGVIDRPERDRRLAQLDGDLASVNTLLLQAPPPAVGAEALADILDVFMGWADLDRDQKRRLLSVEAPEIKVADYRIEGLYLSATRETAAVGFTPLPRLYVPLGMSVR